MMGGVYGPTAQAIYPHGMRLGRRDGGHPVMSLRSPVLDEFRSNKARKWELRVRHSPIETWVLSDDHRISMVTLLSSAATNMGRVSYNRN